MATRSFIVKKGAAGDYAGVYCHFDGYPEGVGVTLRESYNTVEGIGELIEQGSISFLKGSIAESRFYHTWRNDPLKVYRKLDWEEVEQTAKQLGCEYVYAFEDGEWKDVKVSG